MNKKRKGARRWTALALSVAMVFSGIGILPAPVKAEAADVAAAVQKTGATTERSERKMKFGDDWKFKLVNKYNINDTSVQADGVDYDDSSWDNVDLPHDWAIYGTYENSNGVRAAQGSLAGGVGWYRKSFTLSDDFKDKTVSIEFDGVQMISQVWVNGHTEDNWKQYLGYNTFTYDISKYLKYDGSENVIAVKVQSSNSSARWYAGAGIYRNVYLISTEKLNVPVNGVQITTPFEKLEAEGGKYEEIKNATKAGVDIKTDVTNDSDTEATGVSVKSTVYNKESDVISTQTDDITVAAGKTETISQSVDVANPKLWSVDSPNLYWVRTEIIQNGKVVDRTDSRFGIRYIATNPNSGFYLNGVHTKLNGVCEHSDLGSLGMETYQAAVDRRIRTLKKYGVNAIRTSHNPVSPEFIEACDRLGMLVFEEAFDQWLYSKNSDDYHNYFNKAADGKTVVFDKAGNDNTNNDTSYIEVKREDLQSNAERDIKAMVDRDKNAPCIFAWSTGNEIYDARYKHGENTLDMLTGWIKEIDMTRPVAACPPTWDNYWANNAQQEKHLAKAEMSGFNYATGQYDGAHSRYPNMVIFGSETVSAYYYRGVYFLEGEGSGDRCNEYPTYWTFSSATASLEAHRDKTYTAGEFVWTGHDYLGEPTPRSWPSKSSYFGMIDTAGFAKDVVYMYKSMWTDTPTVHLLPQKWNFKAGQKVPVYIYTNAKSVELFLNGKSLGIKNYDKQTASPVYIYWTKGTSGLDYEAGELKAVGYDQPDGKGNVIATDVVNTSGDAAQVELSADRTYIKNDGDDMVFVEATIEDNTGIMVPGADNRITFDVEGGEIVSVDNGDPRDHDPYKNTDNRKAFSGKALLIVKAEEGSTDDIVITATAESDNGILKSNTITVGSKNELPGDGTDTPKLQDASVVMGKGISADSVLPKTVKVQYSNGVVDEHQVTGWNLDNLNVNQAGTYKVTGTAEGMEGTFECTVTVKDIKSATVDNVTTLVNVEPSLPQFAAIEYADGTKGSAPVTWDEVPAENYAKAGKFEVTGKIGPEVTVKTEVSVKEIKSVEEVHASTVIGTLPVLPAGVEVTFTDESKEIVGTDWQIKAEDVAAAGTLKVKSKILGSDMEAVANVDVKYAVATGDLEYTSTGTVSKDKTVNGAGLSVRIDQGGKPTEYAAGLSMLGGSEAVYNVEGKGYEAFRAYVSLSFDNGQDAEGAVSFEVYVDDEKTPRYRSGVMTHATKNLALDVDIKGAKTVKLVTKTEDSSVDNSKNIGNWCDTKFVSSNVAVKSAKLKEKDFYYAEKGAQPSLPQTAEVQVDDTHTGAFRIAWSEIDTSKADVVDVEGTVLGIADPENHKVKAKVIVDFNNVVKVPALMNKIGKWEVKEAFDYVETTGTKTNIKDIEDITAKSSVIYKWTNNMLIENCHNYGFDYGVYPGTNSANPEYLIVRAPAIKGFVLRGTGSTDGNANKNFTFYTSEDGENWKEFKDYTKTTDTSVSGSWPSRLYTATQMPDDTNYIKIAYPTGNTWQFNMNKLQLTGGEVIPEGKAVVSLDANGGSLPEGTSTKRTLNKGDQAGELPTPTRNRHNFKGWFTQPEGGEKVTEETVVSDSIILYAQWEKSTKAEDVPVYFVDCGANAFSAEGKAYRKDYTDTLKNTVPDQAYSETSGWGFTNPASEVEANGSGDAYTTIRNFKAGNNQKTMTYKFALDAGTYEVVTGFYDPWAQWAGDDRHAKITVADEAGTELAVHEDHKISGSKDSVTLENITLSEAGNVTVNLSPLKKVDSNIDSCDVLVSFIVIVKKAAEQPDIPKTDTKAGLKAAIDLAKTLKADDYTAASYKALSDTIASAEKVYAETEPSAEAVQTQINALAEAVRNLKSAAADTKKDLTQQMKEKDAELAAKDTELKTAQKNASDLDDQLKKAAKDLADLKNGSEAEKAELQKQINSLKEQLDEANAKVTVLKAEKERLTEEKTSLQTELKKAQEDAAKKKAEEAEALKKAQEEEKKAKEELQKLKDAMTLKIGDTITVKGVTYRVTNAEAKTAEAYGVVNKNQKHIEVAATVKIKGSTCKVTAIADQAFAGMKKATKAVIGKNVSKIGKKAFNGDGKLKSITVKSRKLKTVGKLALKGINKKAVIRIPKSKKKAYRKLFKGKGQKKSVIVK